MEGHGGWRVRPEVQLTNQHDVSGDAATVGFFYGGRLCSGPLYLSPTNPD